MIKNNIEVRHRSEMDRYSSKRMRSLYNLNSLFTMLHPEIVGEKFGPFATLSFLPHPSNPTGPNRATINRLWKKPRGDDFTFMFSVPRWCFGTLQPPSPSSGFKMDFTGQAERCPTQFKTCLLGDILHGRYRTDLFTDFSGLLRFVFFFYLYISVKTYNYKVSEWLSSLSLPS